MLPSYLPLISEKLYIFNIPKTRSLYEKAKSGEKEDILFKDVQRYLKDEEINIEGDFSKKF